MFRIMALSIFMTSYNNESARADCKSLVLGNIFAISNNVSNSAPELMAILKNCE